MRTTTLFAATYLTGVILGLAAGATLPWWSSGSAGWGALAYGLALRARIDRRFWSRVEATSQAVPVCVGVIAMRAHRIRRERSTAITLGLFWGGLAGAAAADASEVLDALVWPGHEVGVALLAMGVALAWLLGTVVSEEDEAAFRPGLVGFGLYLVTIALAVFPAVWGVLPW